MKAVILAAGEGKRMRPLTYIRPKVMIPIGNMPIMEHLLVRAIEAGISEFIIIVGYHDNIVRDYFDNGSRWNARIKYYQQKKQLGTADALRIIADELKDNFIVMNGDIITSCEDINRLTSQNNTTLSTIRVVDGGEELGYVELDGEQVVEIYEKTTRPSTSTANAGLYLFTPLIFEAISKTQVSPRGEYEITDSIRIMIADGEPVCSMGIDNWLDVSYPWDLLTANEVLLKDLKGQVKGDVEEGVSIKGIVDIGKETTVRSGSYLVGPIIIGDNCIIGPNCYIRPSTAIGNNCHIGAATEIKNSIIMNNTKVPHHNYVGDSVIGENCNLASGTKIANLRFDKKDIEVNGIGTNRHKFGAILGDNIETGINSSINTGTMIGNNTFIGPGAVASDIIAPDSRML